MPELVELAMTETANVPVAAMESPTAAFLNPGVRAYMQEVAEDLSRATIIPAQFRNKPADCFLALHMAARLRADPLVIMQNLYIVQGNPGWNAAFCIAQANASGVFSTPIEWEETGESIDDLSVVAFATLAKTGNVARSTPVSMRMAKLEGWTKNKKYETMYSG